MKNILIVLTLCISTNLFACEIPPSYPNLGVTHDSITKWTMTAGALLKKSSDGKFHFMDSDACPKRMDGLIIRGNLGTKGLGAEIGWGAGLPLMGTYGMTYSFLYLPNAHGRFEQGVHHGVKFSIIGSLFSINLSPYINHNGNTFFSAGIGMGI